jgi:hypothetical protein
MILILNYFFTVVFYPTCIYFKKINLICSIFTIYFKFYFDCCVLCNEINKTNPACICFKELLNQLNLVYICICLYLQQIKSYGHAS